MFCKRYIDGIGYTDVVVLETVNDVPSEWLTAYLCSDDDFNYYTDGNLIYAVEESEVEL